MTFSLDIIIPLFLVVLSFSISLVPFEQWLLLYVCQSSPSNSKDWDYCTSNVSVQRETSLWTIYFSLCSNIPSIFVTPLLGGLSDSIGRKPILLLTVASGLWSLREEHYKNRLDPFSVQ